MVQNKDVFESEIFGSNVFNDIVMQERLPKSLYKKLKRLLH